MDDHHYQFLTSFITIGLGYTCARTGILARDDAAPIARLLYGLLVPMLILGSMTRMKIEADFLLYAGLAAGYTLTSVLVALLAHSQVESLELRGMLTMATVGTSLPFGLPLIQSVWGTEGVLLAFLFDIPNVLAIFGFQPILAHKYSPLQQTEAPVETEPTDSAPTEQSNDLHPAAAATELAEKSEADDAEEAASTSHCTGVRR